MRNVISVLYAMPPAALKPLVALVALVAAATLPATARAEQPLWELGLGVGVVQLPHYRGSDQQHTWLLPVPYLVYRGEVFKADREGPRAELFNREPFQLDLSAAANAPTRSRDNRAREGMPDLAPTLELGPNLNWTLRRGPGWKLALRLPVRLSLALDSGLRTPGWIATPNLNLELRSAGGWNLGLQTGPVLTTRGLNAYFYDVDPAHATASRPAYRAPGGYAGWTAMAALSRRDGKRWLAGFVKYDQLGGAAFADSPLLRQRQQWSGGVAVSWVFAQSATPAGSRP